MGRSSGNDLTVVRDALNDIRPTKISDPALGDCDQLVNVRAEIEEVTQLSLDTADQLIALLDEMHGNFDEEVGGISSLESDSWRRWR